MSTASPPSDPSASDDLLNAASLAIMVLPPYETSSNPSSNIPSLSNVAPGSIRRTETVRRRTRSTHDVDVPLIRPYSSRVDRRSVMSAFDLAPLPDRFCCYGYEFLSPDPSDRPYSACEGAMAMYADSLTHGPGIEDNPEWRKPHDHVEVDQFDIKIELGNALQVRVNDGHQWDVIDLIIPELLVEAGLATALVIVSSPSVQSSPKSVPPSNPSQNDLSSSFESDDGSDDDSDASESEDDSDDSSSLHSPLQPHPHEYAHSSLSEGANSSLSNPLYSTSIIDPDVKPFVRVEDPVGGDDYVEIMLDLDDPLASDFEEA
ncbi:hypothetical protein Dimus_035705 [Dionaea muscipula]